MSERVRNLVVGIPLEDARVLREVLDWLADSYEAVARDTEAESTRELMLRARTACARIQALLERALRQPAPPSPRPTVLRGTPLCPGGCLSCQDPRGNPALLN